MIIFLDKNACLLLGFDILANYGLNIEQKIRNSTSSRIKLLIYDKNPISKHRNDFIIGLITKRIECGRYDGENKIIEQCWAICCNNRENKVKFTKSPIDVV